MLPLRLKYDPHFDIDKDLRLIRQALKEPQPDIRKGVIPFPTSRAYIVTAGMTPVAIFDGLGPGFGAILKLALTMMPNHIDNPAGYEDVEVMNVLRQAVHAPGFKRPYTLAVFVADKVLFHLTISTDLLIVLCERLRSCDIVNRDFWEYVYDAGIE